MAVVRAGIVGTGSRDGDAARRELPTFMGYARAVVLVNDVGQVFVDDAGWAYVYEYKSPWDVNK